MKTIFVDPQGNVQEATPLHKEIALREPDKFIITECSDIEFNLYCNGFIYQDGVPVVKNSVSGEIDLDKEKEREMAAAISFFEERKKNLRDARINAVMLDRDATPIDEAFIDTIEKQKETIRQINAAETYDDLLEISYK